MKTPSLFALTFVTIVVLATPTPRAQQEVAPAAPDAGLKPTTHPRLPSDPSLLWLAPESRTPRTAAMKELETAVKLEVESNFAKALPMLSEARVQPVDRHARVRLRALWTVIGPFEPLVAAEPLALAARRAEGR